jgi:SAM-dependent MidA family methyltransferase
VSLRDKILREIREHGPIPFSRYMGMCLYDPELGYYSRHAEQFGKAGDFYTSSDVHAVFGRLLSRHFEEIWRAVGSPTEIQVLEFGPGRGLFAQDVLDWSEKKFPDFARALQYRMVESSAALCQRLGSRFERRENVRVYRELGDIAMSEHTIVFANEWFDAFPVEIVTSQGLLHVGESDEKFVETFRPAPSSVSEYLDRYSIHPQTGERVEAPLEAFRAMDQICSSINSGITTIIDYGYTRAEQLEGRHLDTIMTYRQHSASPDPYEAPGEQDITAHVNFSALSAVAEKNGFAVQPLLTQAQFLMGIGETTQFGDAFEGCQIPQEYAKVALQLKHLVTPAGMGESFQVLIGSKGVDTATIADLSGVSFAKSRL